MVKGFEQVIADVNNLLDTDRRMRIALTTVLAESKQRIFVNGQDSSGSKIGSYSTKEISISRKNQARQTGKTFFSGGYREYKQAIGKGGEFVNLRNTDQMFMDYGLIKMADKEYGFGFQNSFNFDKSQWMEEKYNKDIFAPTRQEEDLFLRIL